MDSVRPPVPARQPCPYISNFGSLMPIYKNLAKAKFFDVSIEIPINSIRLKFNYTFNMEISCKNINQW